MCQQYGKRTYKVNGEHVKIPQSMTYSEWKKAYVDKLEEQKIEKTRIALQTVMVENNIKGELAYPPPKMDFSTYKFDKEHTQGDQHPHDVTEEDARQFINDAYITIIRYKGANYNYYGAEDATFVRIDLKTIRTAFKSEEYDDKIKKLIEVCENGF